MYYTYVIQSEKDGHFYTGFTRDLRNRLQEHNAGNVASTKSRSPFRLVYYEGRLNEQDATAREKYLKSGMGKRYLKNRIKRFLSLSGVNPLNLKYPDIELKKSVKYRIVGMVVKSESTRNEKVKVY